MRCLLTLGLFAVLVACGSDDDGGGDSPDAGGNAWPDQYVFGGDRPVDLEVPDDYNHAEPTPLLILLHGYGANAFVQTAYTGLDALVGEAGILFAAPDGLVDGTGKQFWNAGPACCGVNAPEVDDVAYIGGLIEEIAAVWNVDPDRVYLVGHSNGGFMSYRMACDRPDLIAGIVNLAGAAHGNSVPCDVSEAVSVLHIHGDADDVVPYEGTATYPGAVESVQEWATRDGCTGGLEAAGSVDIERRLDGAETVVEATAGCPAGVGVDLWTIVGGSHLPALSDNFRTEIWNWLAAHPKQ
jgi:polyhydroxybutyrate depolymerase